MEKSLIENDRKGAAGDEKDCILKVEHLKTWFNLGEGRIVKAVDDISFCIRRGRITAIVGQSGSGKSVTSMSVFNLVDSPGKVVGGRILFEGQNLLEMSEKKRGEIYGRDITMIFQEPMSALNPVVKIKKQMMEMLLIHRKSDKKEAFEKCVDALEKVNLKNARELMEKYPFELSGGMCQRVMIAMSVVAGAKLLIADEPTSALDLTVQAVVLDEIRRLKENGMSVMLITHDLGVVAQMADYVYVMNEGRIVEEGDVFAIFDAPKHEYTKTLIGAAMMAR